MILLDRKKAPEFKQVDNIQFLDAIKTSLDNGIEVNYINGGSQDIIKIDFIFNAGNLYQNKPLVASSTNQLIKEGTKNYSAFEISEGIDKYGAFFETENAYDTATLTLYTLTKHLNNVLPYVKEVLLFPEFSEKEFEIYKNNAIERFKINLEKVSFIARKEFMRAIFGNENPYGSDVTLNDYENLSVNDIKAFYTENYNLGNCRILISGKVKTSTINVLNDFFGQEKTIKKESIKIDFPKNTNNHDSVYIEKENALQSAIRIGRLFPNKLHEDYFGLEILNTVLGGYFGSRLMNNIREDKGYTYGIGSGILSLQHAGYFFISTEVGSDVTKKALIEIYKEIEIIRTQEIPVEELELVKNYLLGQLLTSCDGPFNMGSLFDSVHEYGLDYNFYNKYIQTIKEITPKTLLALGVKYFNKTNLTEIVVGKL
ncbi:MAG: insulinase family protein [Flavobacteriales bacterium]|nr:insulinase family protein [Flavobacteriales bacterium]